MVFSIFVDYLLFANLTQQDGDLLGVEALTLRHIKDSFD
jgi:hypothetical protein